MLSPSKERTTAGEINVGRYMFMTFAGQVMAYAQGLIVMPIAIRLAGEATYGAYVLSGALLSLLFGSSSFGAGYRYRRSLASASTPIERRRLFEPQFTFQLLSLAAISSVLAATWSLLDDALFAHAIHVSAWVMILWLATYFIYAQATEYFRYALHFLCFNIGVGIYPYLFVLSVILAAKAGYPISVDTLLCLQMLGHGAVGLVLMLAALRDIGMPMARLPIRELREDICIGVPLTLELIIGFLLASSDRYLISLFLTVADVGRYQPAYQLAALILFIPKVGGAVLPPALAWIMDRDGQDRARNVVTSFLRIFLMVAIPFAVGDLMIGPSIIGMLANPSVGFAGAWVGPLVALAAIFSGINLVAFQVAFVLGKTKMVLGANLVGAGVNVALNLTLLYGLRDIRVPAAVSLASYAISCLYVRRSLQGVWPLNFEGMAVLRFCVAGCVMGGVLWWLGYRPATVIATSVPGMARSMVMAAISYFIVLSLLGGFGRRELRQVVALVGRPVPV